MSDDGTEEGNGPQKVEDLPDWAQKLITDTRSEAASYRSKLRDAEKSAREKAEYDTEQKFQGKVTDLEKKLEDAQKSAEDNTLSRRKLEVALEAGVPGDRAAAFAERLRGSSDDELKQDADDALKVFGVGESNGNNQNRATDSTQGVGSDDSKGPRTPDTAFAEWAERQLSK